MTVQLTKRSVTCAIATAIVWGLLIGLLIHLQYQNAALESAVDMYKHEFRQRIGEDEISGSYHHITLDGGLVWWQCTLVVLPDDSVAVLVDGRADLDLVIRLNKLEKPD